MKLPSKEALVLDGTFIGVVDDDEIYELDGKRYRLHEDWDEKLGSYLVVEEL